MKDIASELEDLYKTIEAASKELQKLNPKHELLKFSKLFLGEEECTNDLWIEYVALFEPVPVKDIPNILALICYLMMLEQALAKQTKLTALVQKNTAQ
jgi:hypothetical protein